MTDEKYLSFTMPDGVVIKATAYGNPSNPPVILSHGGGQTRHAWGETAKALAEQGWYAVAYDHRGHGESGWAPSEVYPLDDFANDQAEIAATFEQKPVLVGASLGGLAAMLAEGEIRSGGYNAVIFVDITPNMSRDGALNIIRFMGEHASEGFATLDEAADVIAEYTGRPRRNDLSGLAKNLRLGENGRYFWHWDPNFLKQRLDPDGDPHRLSTAVGNMQLPILLVRGKESDLVTEEIAQQFLATVPHADYIDVEKARHMVAGDKNDIFTQAVLEFLQKL